MSQLQNEGIPNSPVERRPRLFAVTDTSATSTVPTRVHDVIVDGKTKQITFKYGEPSMLSFAEAMKFQKEGFIVNDEDGLLVQRPSETTVETLSQFGADKVIADLNELTREALYVRAATLPGGEVLKIGSPKDVLVKFIRDSASKKLKDSTATEEVTELADSELDKLGLAAE